MCLAEKLKNKYFVRIDIILIILISIIHFIFFFFIKETNFEDLFDTFESSPLFDFDINKTCNTDSHIIFHEWEGIKETNSNSIDHRTEMNKINGYQFCYKHKSYKDLLYNGQILKKEEKCEGNYIKDCGTIDTLEQHLCIKNEEKCPLYDIGIGEQNNKEGYTINIGGDSNIYFNNDNYSEINKTIIGKLILNDGQPCYRYNEKLWKQFSSEEIGQNHLECDLDIFGLKTDARYKIKGNISYYKLYENNLEEDILTILSDKIKGDEYVSLYKREFLGIDKTCDRKYNITRDKYEKLKRNQKKEKICVFVESLIIFFFLSAIAIYYFFLCYESSCIHEDFIYDILFVFLIICLVLNLICTICQSIFLGFIIKNNLTYDCSDEITNELFRKENLNTKKSISYSILNLVIDIFYILFNIFSVLIVLLIDKIEELQYEYILKKELENNENKNKLEKNKNNVDGINQMPKREVKIINGIAEITNKNDDHIDNNINNNIINEQNKYPSLDLGSTPSIEPEYSSNTSIDNNSNK